MTQRPAVPPWRQLAPLAVAVAAAHAVLLQWAAQDPLQPGTQALHAFVTRTIAPEPPPPVVAAAPAPARAPAPPRRAAASPEPAKAPAPGLAPADTAPAPRADAPPPMPEAAAPAPPAVETTPVAATPAEVEAATSPTPQLSIPAPARLRYELIAEYRGIPVHGNAELEWRHDGTQYEAKLSLHGLLLPRREQRSSGRITAEGLAPRVFYDRSRSEQAAHFDREGGRVTFSNNRPDAPLAAGTQDRLSVVLQLAALVGGEPARYAPGTQIAIPTASTREAETWIFDVLEEEELSLPGGAVRALKLQRKPRKEFDQRIELWLAPRMDYAPVRLRLTNPNGDTVDQRWSSTDRG